MVLASLSSGVRLGSGEGSFGFGGGDSRANRPPPPNLGGDALLFLSLDRDLDRLGKRSLLRLRLLSRLFLSRDLDRDLRFFLRSRDFERDPLCWMRLCSLDFERDFLRRSLLWLLVRLLKQ